MAFEEHYGVHEGLLDITDPGKHRPLVGGILIVGEDSSGGGGTLGCMGTTGGARFKWVALTCAHILFPGPNKIRTDTLVGQPNLSSTCNRKCGNPIGTVLSAVQDATRDCALVVIDPSLDASNNGVIQRQAGIRHVDDKGKESVVPIKGVYEVQPQDTADKNNPYPVLKRGVATELTNGIILKQNFPADVRLQNDVITSMTGLFQIVGTGPGPFSTDGDSGAIVFNRKNEVVGLLIAGNSQASLAIPIKTVIDAFQANTFAISVTAQNPPPVESFSAFAMTDPEKTTVGQDAAPPEPELIRAHEELVRTEQGRALVDAYHRHQWELRRLIETNRRVAAVWHRGKGPVLLQEGFRAAGMRENPFPSEIDGKPVKESLERMAGILHKFGSPSLRQDLNQYAEPIFRLPGLSFAQFLGLLRADET